MMRKRIENKYKPKARLTKAARRCVLVVVLGREFVLGKVRIEFLVGSSRNFVWTHRLTWAHERTKQSRKLIRVDFFRGMIERKCWTCKISCAVHTSRSPVNQPTWNDFVFCFAEERCCWYLIQTKRDFCGLDHIIKWQVKYGAQLCYMPIIHAGWVHGVDCEIGLRKKWWACVYLSLSAILFRARFTFANRFLALLDRAEMMAVAVESNCWLWLRKANDHFDCVSVQLVMSLFPQILHFLRAI